MTRTLPGAESAYDAIERVAEAGLPSQELLEEVARRIERVVPSDGYFIGATDPGTSLIIGSGVVRDLPHDSARRRGTTSSACPDYMKFVDIAASGRSVADLHEETGGRPERSPRWREYGTATGFRSEVRATFTLGDIDMGRRPVRPRSATRRASPTTKRRGSSASRRSWPRACGRR